MQTTNKSSHIWICLMIFCAKMPGICGSKPLITTPQDILRELPLTFTKRICSTYFQNIKNSLNWEKRGFKNLSLAPSSSFNREANWFLSSSSCNSPHHPDVINIWSYLQSLGQYVATQAQQAGAKHSEADMNHSDQTADQIYAYTLTKSLNCHVLMWALNFFCWVCPLLSWKELTCLLSVYHPDFRNLISDTFWLTQIPPHMVESQWSAGREHNILRPQHIWELNGETPLSLEWQVFQTGKMPMIEYPAESNGSNQNTPRGRSTQNLIQTTGWSIRLADSPLTSRYHLFSTTTRVLSIQTQCCPFPVCSSTNLSPLILCLSNFSII